MSELMVNFSQWLLTLTQGAEPWDAYARYLPRLLEGVWITLQLVVLSGIVGFIIAIPLALMRIAKSPGYGSSRIATSSFSGARHC